MVGTIGINTLCIEKFTLTQNLPNYKAFELIRTMGAEGVDLLEDYMEPHPHPNLYHLRELKKLIHSYGMFVNSTWFYTDPLRACYVSDRKKVMDDIKEYIAITGFLGSHFLMLPPGDPAPGMSDREAQEAFIRFYEELLPVAEEYEVIIGMEVGRMHSPLSSPKGALQIVKQMKSKYLTVCPDWEAWRIHSGNGIPDYYAEAPDVLRDPACSVETFIECLEYAPFIHAKVYEYDEERDIDPNYPLAEMLDAVRNSPYVHHMSMEYEGWTPEIYPDRDPLKVSKQLFDMLNRRLKGGTTQQQKNT
ncbi:sugar phosphate isomerase/epimerase family protein [Diplocloster agilis]|uniref:sugar phosphate isomerase/epimerase family protein n=1 Tax=Diplocloster agilis TaxID=2850323 RepID=UPI000821ECC8|nr:TIM barrel protein [Suonthocola fibrivorans]MCU6732325.1 sugar phosphate isomerase/epimerase [Suonthocola fibrivorans]SCI43422.1 Xylose isomerase-like TIM barrel [uncultured Clostridium sp.]